MATSTRKTSTRATSATTAKTTAAARTTAVADTPTLAVGDVVQYSRVDPVFRTVERGRGVVASIDAEAVHISPVAPFAFPVAPDDVTPEA